MPKNNYQYTNRQKGNCFAMQEDYSRTNRMPVEGEKKSMFEVLIPSMKSPTWYYQSKGPKITLRNMKLYFSWWILFKWTIFFSFSSPLYKIMVFMEKWRVSSDFETYICTECHECVIPNIQHYDCLRSLDEEHPWSRASVEQIFWINDRFFTVYMRWQLLRLRAMTHSEERRLWLRIDRPWLRVWLKQY